jgi:plasmid stability protein
MSSTLLIRSLEPEVKTKLKAQADASNRSLEAYLREIVTKAAESTPQVLTKGGTSAVRRRPPTLPGKVIEHGNVLSSEPAALWEPSAGTAL